MSLQERGTTTPIWWCQDSVIDNLALSIIHHIASWCDALAGFIHAASSLSGRMLRKVDIQLSEMQWGSSEWQIINFLAVFYILLCDYLYAK